MAIIQFIVWVIIYQHLLQVDYLSVLHLNYYSGGDVFLGHDGGAPTITVNKWSSNTGKSFEVAGVSEFSGGELIAGGGINTNTINTDGDADMNIQRNGQYLHKFKYSK